MADPRLMQPIFCRQCGAIVRIEPRDQAQHACPECHGECELSEGEQVFVSYSSHDLEAATRVARALGDAGIRFWLAPEFIDGGEDFLRKIPLAIDACKVALILLSDAAVRSPWIAREATLAVSRGKVVVPVSLGMVACGEEWHFLLALSQWMRTEATLPDPDVIRVVRAVVRGLGPATARALVAEVAPSQRRMEAPRGVDPGAVVYMGPRPYPDGMGSRFFGRERELAHLLELIRDRPGVLVISPSGAGKSSLLAAGLAPALRSAGAQVLSGARVGRALSREAVQHMDEIANIFVYSSMHGLGDVPVPTDLNLTLDQSLRRIPRERSGQLRVVIFDQFEEIFTQYRDRFADRAEFLLQLVEAQRLDPALRVVLAMRQEYLAEFNALAAPIAPALRPSVFPLRRMDRDALIEVIRRPAEPWAWYAEGLAEAIVDELNQIRAVQPDGTVQLRPGEHVELVHLQIVCERLWRSLPPGATVIERSHLELVADNVLGRDFGGFVRNALEAFYGEVVLRVARSAATERHGGYSIELIKLGCMRFINRDGSRASLIEGSARTGRLPNWIIDQLADLYLLRSDTVGSERWYELSHDLLAETVARERDQAVSDLLFACDILEKQLEHAQSGNGGSLTGRFESHPDLLVACDRFRQQPGLFAEEAEFLFRASLRDGTQLADWSCRLRIDFPDIRRSVLHEALACAEARVRLHAARILWEDPEDGPDHALVDLLLKDEDAEVRRAAAYGVMQLDRPTLFEHALDGLRHQTSDSDGERAAATLLALADERAPSRFDVAYASLAGRCRARVRLRAWGIRLRSSLTSLAYAVVPGAIGGSLFASAYKWIPGAFNCALVQADTGALNASFHGMVAGFIWGGGIAAGLALHRLVFLRARSPCSLLRPLGALVAGTLAGLLSSLLVVLVVVTVFDPHSLARMGWINALPGPDTVVLNGTNARPTLPARFSATFLHDLFVTTRMGWAHIILGTTMGLGISLMINKLRAAPQWLNLLRDQHAVTSLQSLMGVARRTLRVVVPTAWLVVLTQMIGGAATLALLRPGTNATEAKREVLLGIIGDASTQVLGAIGVIAGIGVGVVLLRRGLHIAPRDAT